MKKMMMKYSEAMNVRELAGSHAVERKKESESEKQKEIRNK